MRKGAPGSSRTRVIRTHAEVLGMLLYVVGCVIPILLFLLSLLAVKEDGSTEASRKAKGIT